MEVFKLYNSAAKGLQSVDAERARPFQIYTCGITPYAQAHVGHARTAIVVDVLTRYLQLQGVEVVSVSNFTDIDDKIIAKANRLGVAPNRLTSIYSKQYLRQLDRLNVLPLHQRPTVTANIAAIQDFIKQLLEKDFAYIDRDGVYFKIARSPKYRASSQTPKDFALWKFVNSNLTWETPWGKKGRPGWHIECSAMIRETLGDTIDLHAGGQDLQFPHHENEIAQSEALTGQLLSRHWLHIAPVLRARQKMSKSRQNAMTLNDAFAVAPPMALRLWLLQSHYAQPVNFTVEALQGAKQGYFKLQKYAQALPVVEPSLEVSLNFLANDLHTPKAIAQLFKAGKTRNAKEFWTLAFVLGLKF